MSVFYLDSSAWVKRYFVEPGSGWVMRLFKSEERLASSVLGYAEVASTLARQQTPRKLDEQKLAQLLKDVKDYTCFLQPNVVLSDVGNVGNAAYPQRKVGR